MAPAYRDPLEVQVVSYFLGAEAIHYEGKNSSLLFRSADDVQPWNAFESRCGIREQHVLVA